MFRPAAQSLLRSSTSTLSRRALQLRAPTRRHASTAPPHAKSSTWKGAALRWGLAAGGVYWYNTSPVFAEEPAYPASRIPHTETEDENLPTIDELAAARAARKAQSAAFVPDERTATIGDPGQLEEEAEGEGAFNPETGEINWDCPCLGGMAYGPCGEEFRAAFSCFVFSKEEPKGMDCIDRFRGMQDCFRLHPDIYGEELADDDEGAEGVAAPEGGAEVPAPEQQPVALHASTSGAAPREPAPPAHASTPPAAPERQSAPAHPSTSALASEPASDASSGPSPEPRAVQDLRPHETNEERVRKHDAIPESDELVPRAWHDTRGDDSKKSA